MASPAVAGPSQLISLSGTTVGQLDPTQVSRLLSTPGGKLSFASYDPYAACSNRPSLSAKDTPNARRIVIETLPSGSSSWRWVPRARGVDTVTDEGSWPRVINICGQQVFCSQEQWDIYKLDPAYDCTIHSLPQLTSITPRKSEVKANAPGFVSSGVFRGKRRKETSSDDDEPQASSPRKRMRPVEVETDEDDTDSDDEVEEMIMGDDGEMYHERIKVANERRRKIEKKRQERREKNTTRTFKFEETQDVSMIDLASLPESPQPPLTADAAPQEPPSRTNNAPSLDPNAVPSLRKTPSNMPGSWADSSPPLGKTDHWTDMSSSQSSRTSTWTDASSQTSWGDSSAGVSTSQPGAGSSQDASKGATENDSQPAGTTFKKAKREAESPTGPAPKRMRRTKPSNVVAKSKSRLHAKLARLRLAEEEAFMAGIRPSVSEGVFRPASDGAKVNGCSGQPEAEYVADEDPISLEEKIKRIQELNAYENARARAAKEEMRRRAEEAERERLRKREEQWAREREQAERERREREHEQAKRKKQQQEEQERLRRQKEAQEEKRRQQQEERWTFGQWTSQRALERYKSLAEAFDAAQFSAENPVSFLTIPWPVLHRPTKFNVEDIDWQAVERFFETVRAHMRGQDYKTFVEKSHRRFHPDRWRARRVLQSIEDEELKACLEVAANTVAQALTPIWREVKKD